MIRWYNLIINIFNRDSKKIICEGKPKELRVSNMQMKQLIRNLDTLKKTFPFQNTKSKKIKLCSITWKEINLCLQST